MESFVTPSLLFQKFTFTFTRMITHKKRVNEQMLPARCAQFFAPLQVDERTSAYDEERHLSPFRVNRFHL